MFKTDGYQYCNCANLKFNEKYEVRLFKKCFEGRSCYYQKTFSIKMTKSKRFQQKNTSVKTNTRANIAILKTFTDHGISKAPLTVIQKIYLYLICLTKKTITKDLNFKVYPKKCVLSHLPCLTYQYFQVKSIRFPQISEPVINFRKF